MTYLEHRASLEKKIKKIAAADFETLALEVFRFQARYNPIYQKFLSLLNIAVPAVDALSKIPFLPISLFKQNLIQTGVWTPEVIFTSSTTGGGPASLHACPSFSFYLEQTKSCFSTFYGKPENWTFLALLPAYLERPGSSLVAMMQEFIRVSNKKESGFFLDNRAKLAEVLEKLEKEGRPTILWGVSFALLDLAEQFPQVLKNTIILETGGMKGRREELTRSDLHAVLKNAFSVEQIHSEYGMTELFSQAYSTGAGIFRCPTAMRILIREVTDPFCLRPIGLSGAVNILDLANLDTCAFIATDDLGKLHHDGSFEIIGRVDNSEMRGCNLMVE